MDRAKALTGRCAGEWVDANQPNLTYEACKAWKLYCPKCYQPIHLRKSEKRKSCFAHYDFEDKACPERAKALGRGYASFSSEAQDQDLEEAESFIKNIFYGINQNYFQNLYSKESLDQSTLIITSIDFFFSTINTEIRRWIRFYCENTGFLDWQNPDKELNYVMDCLNILSERPRVARDVIRYASYIYDRFEFDLQQVQIRFGLPITKRKEEQLVSLILLNLLIDRLSEVAAHGIQTDFMSYSNFQIHFTEKIQKNNRKVVFKKQGLSYLMFFDEFNIQVHKSQHKKTIGYISFKSNNENLFWYCELSSLGGQDNNISSVFSQPDQAKKDEDMQYKYVRTGKNKVVKERSQILRVTAAASIETLYDREEKNKKRDVQLSRGFTFLQGEPIELYIDEGGDLSIKGEINQRHRKSIIKGIAKILFNRSKYSMLTLLDGRFISHEVAAKAAQLTFANEYPNLKISEALNRFRSLSER